MPQLPNHLQNFKLAELSESLATQGFHNEIDGDPQVVIRAANTLEDARAGEISFLANPKYRDQLLTTHASAVIVPPGEKVPDGIAALRCSDPYGAITAAIKRIYGPRKHPHWGLSKRASIAQTSRIGENANIGPHVTLAERVQIGRNATVYPGCYVGEGVTIGDDVTLYPNVVIYEGTHIGNRVTLHAGTVVGQDGLGYAPVDGQWLKIPPVGTIIIEDDVEMGACCALDRATLGETRIGKGTKLSDLVVIGHGTKIGEHCMFVAQVGVAGSVTIGDGVILAGQAGVAGHLSIGDRALIGAKSAVWSSVKAGTHSLGYPATNSYRYRRQVANVQRLPELQKRLRALEIEVEQLRKRLEPKK